MRNFYKYLIVNELGYLFLSRIFFWNFYRIYLDFIRVIKYIKNMSKKILILIFTLLALTLSTTVEEITDDYLD